MQKQELHTLGVQLGTSDDTFLANASICLSNVSTLVQCGATDQAAAWQQAIGAYCGDTSQPDAAARCCSPATILVARLRHKIDLRVCVADPVDPASDPTTRTPGKRTCYEWRRESIKPRTFVFDYCSCDASAQGLGRGVCPTGSLVVAEAMAWHCEASVMLSALQVQGPAVLTSCPKSLDYIGFRTKELGLMQLDLAVLEDSNWGAANGCYGTLRCVDGPCVSGQETSEETAARCGQAQSAASEAPPTAVIKFVYPNTGATIGTSRITVVGECFGQTLRGAQDASMAVVSIGPFACDSLRIESPSRISCRVGPGFGAMRAVKMLLGASKRSVPCADSTGDRCTFHYRPPRVLANVPQIVSDGGGRVLTVTGRDFGHPRDTPTLSLRVLVAGQICQLEKTAVCPECGYNQDGVLVCVLSANTLKRPARVTVEVSSTGAVQHSCSDCPAGYEARGTGASCQCVATATGGEVNHMPSWGKVILFLEPSDVADASTDAAAGTRRSFNSTSLRRVLVDLLGLMSEEQVLLVPPGFDLTSAGQLVQIPRKPQDMVSEDGLEKVMMQVLASPQNVDAHVKALFDLAAAAEDGSLREALPTARRVSIPQLKGLRSSEYEVKVSEPPAPPPPPATSALWVPILVAALLGGLPLAVGGWWSLYQRPLLQAQSKPALKTSRRKSSGLAPEIQANVHTVAGQRFGLNGQRSAGSCHSRPASAPADATAPAPAPTHTVEFSARKTSVVA